MKQPPHTRTINACTLGLVLLLGGLAHADAPRIFAITDARIVTAPGQVIDEGTVVVRDGLIESVGAGVAVPADARVFAADATWSVYAAFIDAASAVALETEASNGRPAPPASANRKKLGAAHELDSVRAHAAAVDLLDVAHSSVERHRQLGFAVAHVLPNKGVFRGESTVILLREAPAAELILVDRFAQVLTLEKSSFMARRYPSSTIGAVAAIRQTLLDAQRQLVWRERYEANPAGMPPPGFRASDPALLALLRGERQAVFVSRARLDPGRFQLLMNEFDLQAMTVASGLGQPLRELQAAEMPILLPLELPEKPDLDDMDTIQDVSLRDLQTVVRAPALPAELADAGVEFAFVTDGMKSARDVPDNLAKVIEAGLDADRALAALTTVPARLLGLNQIAGTIAPGKLANLLVVDGELFAAKPKLLHLFVDGYHEEFEAEEVIGDPNAVVDPRGTWEIVTEVMGRSAESTWTIEGSKDNYRGFSESDRAGKRKFKSVSLRGNALTVVSESPRGEVDITVVVTGERLKGDTTMESPRGSATMTVAGKRVAGPESELQ
ncbi:MAG: amidohydrolase family protein [Gammaproteobacteria bacterium]|nr:amidohydrolase family protein [Gammaproteobacteria bacterium]